MKITTISGYSFLLGCALVSFLMAVASPASAATINFTTGYTDGSLAGQNGWAIGNNGVGRGDYIIAAGTGLNIVKGTGTGAGLAFAHRNTASPVTVGTGRILTLDFSFSETAGTMSGTAGTMRSIVGVGFSEYINDSPRLNVSLARVAGATDQYALKLGYSSATPVVTGPSNVLISASALGLDFANGDTTSDALQIAFNAVPTTSFTAWSITGTLTNVTTGLSFSFSDTLTTTAFYNLNYYDTILNALSADASSLVGVNNVIATSFGAPIAVPEPSTWLMLGMGVVLLASHCQRRRQAVRI